AGGSPDVRAADQEQSLGFAALGGGGWDRADHERYAGYLDRYRCGGRVSALALEQVGGCGHARIAGYRPRGGPGGRPGPRVVDHSSGDADGFQRASNRLLANRMADDSGASNT